MVRGTTVIGMQLQLGLDAPRRDVFRRGSARASDELTPLTTGDESFEQLHAVTAPCSALSTSSSWQATSCNSNASIRESSPMPSAWPPKFPFVSRLRRMVRGDVKGKGRDTGPSSLAMLSHLALESIARLWNVFQFDTPSAYESCMELARRVSEEQIRKRGVPGESSTSAIAFRSAHSHLPLIAQAQLYSDWVRWHNSCV